MVEAMKVIGILALAVALASAQCPDDWTRHGQSCYLFVDEFVSWATAAEICRVANGKMVEITSESENDFSMGQLKQRRMSAAWVGIVDFIREGHWVYMSSLEPAGYFNWAPNQPDNANTRPEGGEDCISLHADTGQWDDLYCELLHHSAVICETE